MPTIHRILASTALCLAAAGLSSCQQTKEVPYGEEMLPIDDGEMPIFDYFSVISLQNRLGAISGCGFGKEMC